MESRNSLVFNNIEPSHVGERALYSKEVSIYGDSVIQFDVRLYRYNYNTHCNMCWKYNILYNNSHCVFIDMSLFILHEFKTAL